MSYDPEIIVETLKEKVYDKNVDYDEVLKTVEYIDGQYIFTVNDVGFVFIGNILIDALPGWKSTGGR